MIRIRAGRRWAAGAVSAIAIACGSTQTPGNGGAPSGASGDGGAGSGRSNGGGTGGSSAGGAGASSNGGGGDSRTSAAGTSGAASSGTATGGTASGGGDAGGSVGGGDSGGSGAPGSDGGGGTGPAAWSCPTGLAGKVPTLAGATPTRVAGVPPPDTDGAINSMGYGFSTIEGPVWTGDALLVSEFGTTQPPPSRILQISPGGAVRVMGPAGWNPGTNGLAIDSHGTLFGAVHLDGSISRFDLAAGTRTPIVSSYAGARFNAPNDLAIRSDGTIYFSDPAGYQSPSPAPQAQQRVYRIPPGSSTATVVDPAPGLQPLNVPNGVTLSLDESTLYVSSSGGVYAFPVMNDGSTGPRPATPLLTANIDGMVIDCAGNVYAAVVQTNTVRVFSPPGAPLGTITVPGTSAVSNVAFGGSDHKTLYITSQGQGGGRQPPGSSAQGVYSVALDIPGKPY